MNLRRKRKQSTAGVDTTVTTSTKPSRLETPVHKFVRNRPVTTVLLVLGSMMAVGFWFVQAQTHLAIDVAKNEVAAEALARADALEEATQQVNLEICNNSNEARKASSRAFTTFVDVLISAANEDDDPTEGDNQQQIDQFVARFNTDVLPELEPINCNELVGAAMRRADKAYEAELIVQEANSGR